MISNIKPALQLGRLLRNLSSMYNLSIPCLSWSPAPHYMDLSLAGLSHEMEEIAEKIEMWFDAKKCLTEMDEDGNVKNGIWDLDVGSVSRNRKEGLVKY